MKKNINKIIITLIVIMISFFVGINSTKALNECNIGDKNSSRGYGSVDGSYSNPNYSQGATVYINPISQETDQAISKGWKKNSWSSTREFNIIYAVPKGAKVETFSMTFYDDDGEALCELTNKNWSSDLVGKQYGIFHFNLTSGHVARIIATGTYEENNKSKEFKEKTFFIGKKVGDTGSVSNKTTTKSTEKGETTTTSTRSASDGEKNEGPKAAIRKGSSKKMELETNADGEIINSLDKDEACTEVSGLIHDYWKYVMIIVPILLIVMITIDFFKALAKGDSDSIKKAGNNTIKRAISAVVLLALPALLGLIFSWFGLDLCV